MKPGNVLGMSKPEVQLFHEQLLQEPVKPVGKFTHPDLSTRIWSHHLTGRPSSIGCLEVSCTVSFSYSFSFLLHARHSAYL